MAQKNKFKGLLKCIAVFVCVFCCGIIGLPQGDSNFDKNKFDDEIFPADKIHEIKITINESDWNSLRMERHNLFAALGEGRITNPEPEPYKVYRADVEINGKKYSPVGIKKRGFLGSSSFTRPSLGIRFDEFDKNLNFYGLKRISLNNNIQDPSLIRQFLTYKVFNKAGLPAPKCNFAKVYVNGKYLGIYTHVEAVTGSFLKRNFGNDSGNLYEGQLSDFRPEWYLTFEKKNNKASNNRDDLKKVVEALEVDDSILIDRLNECIDLEQYISFWAMEVLTGFWDCYSNNGNNFFVYNDPVRKKFVFIPWGADATFGENDPFSPPNKPLTVMTTSILPWRLYRIEKTREEFRAQLRRLLETVWNEKELLSEVERLEELLKPHLRDEDKNFYASIGRVRDFIKSRKEMLMKELNAPAPVWKQGLRKRPYLEKAGAIRAEFSTIWRGINYSEPGFRPYARLRMVIDGERQYFVNIAANVEPARDPRFSNSVSIYFVGLDLFRVKWMLPLFLITPELITTNQPIILDGTGAAGILLEGKILSFNIKTPYVISGTITFESAEMRDNGKIKGKIEGDIYQFFKTDD